MAGDQPFVEHARDGDVHVLRIANAPVNTLRTEVRAGLLDVLTAEESGVAPRGRPRLQRARASVGR